MDGGVLTPETLIPCLTAADPALKDAASWIVGRHPDWGGALAGYLRMRLDTQALSESDRTELEQQLGRFARAAEAIQSLLSERLQDDASPDESRLIALRAMAGSAAKPVPDRWVEGLSQILAGKNKVLRDQAVATARALPIASNQAAKPRSALIALANDESLPVDLRLGALAAAPGGPGALDEAAFEFARSHLSLETSVSRRGSAADVLSRAKLTPTQLITLTDSMKSVGPMEMNRLLSAFEQQDNEQVGLALVSAFKNASALSSLRPESLKPALAKFGAAVQKEAEALYATMDANFVQQKAKLESLVSTVSGGDVRRGQSVFNNTKAACSSCHAIGYLGGKVGPDLTRIGGTRSERDLLESIVFPSASFVRSYEPVLVATKDGKVHNGILKRDSDEVVLATTATEEIRIPRSEIDEMKPGTVSIMPAGLDQQLSAQDLADLVAFLRASR
jgi:putative heme-binding domain-containing protein